MVNKMGPPVNGSCVTPHVCEVRVVELLAVTLVDPDGRRSTAPAANIYTYVRHT